MKRIYGFALCVALAGCGTRSNGPARASVKMAVLMNGLQAQQMPLVLAHSLGYFQDEGVDVTLENLGTNSKTLQALVGGSVDVAGIGHTQPIQMAAEGQHIRTFFTGTKRNNIVILTAPRASARIRTFEDAKGAVAGIPSPGSSTHLFLNFHLKRHGVPLETVQAVSVGSGAASFAAVESGRVDLIAVSGGDHLRILKRLPGAKILLDGSTEAAHQEAFGGDLYSGFLGSKQEWLDKNPDTARRLAKAAVRALGWIASHKPEEIWDKLPEGSRSEDRAGDEEIIRWSLPFYTTDGAMPAGAAEAMKRYLDVTVDKVREAKVDLNAVWTNDYLPGHASSGGGGR